MNDEKSLNITVNPTANTAITTLIMLANAGYEKALAILEKMGVEKEKIFHGVDPSDMVNRPSDIVRELRYVALNRTIEETGLSVLMDLPCGYTPKVFEFTEKGMQYIGCDLPAVINDFSPIIASMTDDEQKKNIDFQVVRNEHLYNRYFAVASNEEITIIDHLRLATSPRAGCVGPCVRTNSRF